MPQERIVGQPCEARPTPRTSTSTLRWFETYDNVTTLGRWLMEQGFTGRQLQSYYEKPWKWTEEWEALTNRPRR